MRTDYDRLALAAASETLCPISPIRIAVVEDMQCIADLIVCLCEQHWGLEVVTVAHTAAAALKEVLTSKPDVVLLDLGLPDSDGITLGADHGVARLVMVAGEAQGDVINGFSGAGAKGGDVLMFQGFGAHGRVVAKGGSVFEVSSADGSLHETFTLTGVSALGADDVLFR